MATRASRLTQPVVVGRVVYGTITVMTVLVIYDGWQNLRFVDVVAVIVGPVLAVLAGLAVGGLVLALQIVLQPGKVASGGGL